MCHPYMVSDFRSFPNLLFQIIAHNLESLNVIIENEDFEKDGVVVNLQWPTDNIIYISFNVSTTPVVQPISESTSMTGATFTVAYNTFYNISVVATPRDHVCNRVRMALIPLHYSELTS